MQATADKIAAHGLEAPALFLLELNRPISMVLHTAALVIEPLTGALFGYGVTRAASELLSCRDNFDKLVQAIELKSAQGSAGV